jgi:prophage DNA circulation protein
MHITYYSGAAQSCELLNKTYTATAVATTSTTYTLRRVLSNTLTTYQLRNGDLLGYAAQLNGTTPTQSLALDLYNNKYQYQVSTIVHAVQYEWFLITVCLL